MKTWLPEELEVIPCDFCGSTKVVSAFIRADQMRVVECAVCGLAYLNPRPKPAFIPRFYDADYFTGAAAERGEGGLRCNIEPSSSQLSEDQKVIPRPIAIINEHFGGLKGKSVLEIGCATGDILQKIQKEGARTKGLEISDFAASVARQRGLDVTTGTIEDFVESNNSSYDIVLALEVIEHIQNPALFLKYISGLINPEGVVLISTPNYACTRRFGAEWSGLNGSFEHLFFFDLKTLSMLSAREALLSVYHESSHYLGQSLRAVNNYRRQLERVKTLGYFIRELGLVGAIKAISTKTAEYYICSVGHTLIVALKKSL